MHGGNTVASFSATRWCHYLTKDEWVVLSRGGSFFKAESVSVASGLSLLANVKYTTEMQSALSVRYGHFRVKHVIYYVLSTKKVY